MIWTPERNAEQSTVVARLYAAAAGCRASDKRSSPAACPALTGAAPPRSPARTCPATSPSASR